MTLILSVLTVGFGLARAENQKLDFSAGNFNVLAVRYGQLNIFLTLYSCIVLSGYGMNYLKNEGVNVGVRENIHLI